jgi:malonyl-CoA O-methyltransferase
MGGVVFQTRDPKFGAKVEAIFKRAAFIADLGAELESAEPGAVVARLKITPRHLQQDLTVHAAVQAALADHSAGGAAASLVEPEQSVLTVEYKINLLRAARGQLLRCKSRVLRPGSAVTVAESDVFTLGAGGQELLTAKAIVTLAVVRLSEALAAEAYEVSSTREGYDRWSEIYDNDQNPLVALEEPELDRALGDVAGLRIADIGCGTGRHTLRLLARGARVSGLDFSAGMMERARAKLAARPEEERARADLRLHDLAERLPFEDGQLDRLVCALVLDHVAELGALFREFRRVVRREGRVVVSVMHPAMNLRGVEARFVDPKTGREVRPRSVTHQIADYVQAAIGAGLAVERLGEHAVDDALAARLPRARKYLGWPMLLMLELRPT